jgi:hypothetical protein
MGEEEAVYKSQGPKTSKASARRVFFIVSIRSFYNQGPEGKKVKSNRDSMAFRDFASVALTTALSMHASIVFHRKQPMGQDFGFPHQFS